MLKDSIHWRITKTVFIFSYGIAAIYCDIFFIYISVQEEQSLFHPLASGSVYHLKTTDEVKMVGVNSLDWIMQTQHTATSPKLPI